MRPLLSKLNKKTEIDFLIEQIERDLKTDFITEDLSGPWKSFGRTGDKKKAMDFSAGYNSPNWHTKSAQIKNKRIREAIKAVKDTIFNGAPVESNIEWIDAVIDYLNKNYPEVTEMVDDLSTEVMRYLYSAQIAQELHKDKF